MSFPFIGLDIVSTLYGDFRLCPTISFDFGIRNVGTETTKEGGGIVFSVGE